ncbi:MAG: hypothetical protein E6H03_08630 [Bacillati bacterium ANGP1]|uniref:6-phosphogluconate dehydrogenase NADP-binding domain-containing protein n=1 Tax=Candidatus Segetimicrobium genomatis TaxID=2569760 RepID=A0A537J9T6_9BACT|nr:MAG: hypothetical protein E6H03_08630 [Terrabacteria group bacterium ANGP1]
MEMVVGFVGLGAMGSEMVRRLLAAGRKIAGYNRTRSKAQPLLDAGAARGHGGARRDPGRARAGEDLHRHEHGQPGGEPGPGGSGGRARRADARRPGVGEHGHGERGQAVVHGRRGEDGLRCGDPDPARHRRAGDLRGRPRPGRLDEDRHQPEPGRSDARLQRRDVAGREGRHPA